MANRSTDSDYNDSDYNAAAVRFADALHSARQALPVVSGSGTPAALFPTNNRPGYGVALEYERMGNRPVSTGLQERARAQGIEFEHLATTIGTVLHNINLQEPQADDTVQLIRDTLLERKVIFFRDQHLTEDQQVAFGRCFGALDAFPFGKSGDNPYILEIIHGDKNPGTENGWHTDVTWMERPSLGSIAQCVEVPPIGGDTLFADSHAAYLGLPTQVQERLRHLRGINDYRLFLAGPAAQMLADDVVAQLKEEIPFGVSHPLLRTHPETGKTALYIHGGFLRHDSLYDESSSEELDADEARALLSVLLTQHNRPEYMCRFRWTTGSIAFWDNRAVQHYAASDYFPHKRVLRRVTVRGDKPFYEPSEKSNKN